MKPSTFAERLAYARMLFHFRSGRCVSNTDLAAAVGRTQPWLTKWAKSPTPPRDYEVHRPLAAYLDVDEHWLIRGGLQPPETDLWSRWIDARRLYDADGDAGRGPAGEELSPAARRRRQGKQSGDAHPRRRRA